MTVFLGGGFAAKYLHGGGNFSVPLECIGISKRELLDRLAGPNTILNLSYSIHPPLLLKFERRIFCDLDPSEIIYWMTKMEMGQSYHHEFWTIGLNVHGS